MDYYKNCRLCPRNCNINRYENAGYCGCRSEIRAARAGLHLFEEPYISGKEGSGAVFISGCSMKCVFCQNIEISDKCYGIDISIEKIAKIFLRLQTEEKANNINIVTGTHFTPSIAEAIRIAKKNGLSIPIIWNSSCYEKTETLRLLEGLVDIWLPDLKTLDPKESEMYYNAPDYPDAAKEALAYMVSVSKLGFEGNMMKSGVNVRHLVMPGRVTDSQNVLKYLYSTYGSNIIISLMNQYTPIRDLPYKELNRRVTRREYERTVDYAIELGIEKCMIQEGRTASESFIPVFDGSGLI